MKRKMIWYGLALIVVIVGGYAIINGRSSSQVLKYDFATISRGDLESTISATGALSPLTTVDVGTQVSGTIDSVYVDFNDNVKQGQVLAVLDTVLLKTTVLDADANLQRAKAQLEQAQSDYERNLKLFNEKLISDADFLTAKVAVKSQEASVKSAEAALERAQRNLQYAVIRSPIKGTVISKGVETGQTVAASFSTPTLFTIAQDLRRMQILADVDESDIGLIKEGQLVRFEVQTYPNKKFTGVVRQLRLQPTTISNVVTYTVVVDAENEDNLLLPGMTATVDFITDQKTNVLLVPNKALRFTPSEDQLKAVFERRQKEMENLPDSVKAQMQARRQSRMAAGSGGNGGNFTPPADMSRLWYLDSTGQLAMMPVRTGSTDGVNTEVNGRNLTEGMQVIASLSTGETKTSETMRRPMFRPF